MTHRALITGITGQDGSYLTELLISKGYEVHGIIRRASTFNTGRIDHIYQDPNQPSTRLFLHHGDLSSTEWVLNLVYSFLPDELYHLAAQSYPTVSWQFPKETIDINVVGSINIFEAIKKVQHSDTSYDPVLVNACSSAAYGATLRPEMAAQAEEAMGAVRGFATPNLLRPPILGPATSAAAAFNKTTSRRGDAVPARMSRMIAALVLASPPEISDSGARFIPNSSGVTS